MRFLFCIQITTEQAAGASPRPTGMVKAFGKCGKITKTERRKNCAAFHKVLGGS